jgi:hypothetical protein
MRSVSLITRVLPEIAKKLRHKAACRHLSASRYIALLVERDVATEDSFPNAISADEIERRMANREGAARFASPEEALNFLKIFLSRLET